LVTQGLKLARDTGGVVYSPWALTLLAEVHARLGRAAEGLAYAADAARITAKTDERFCEAELHRVRGELLSETGDQAAAEQNYKDALAAARRRVREPSSYAPPRALPASGASAASVRRPAISSHRSTDGSPKVSIRRFRKTLRRCSSRWRD
jgi:hypothetical protein